MPSFLQVCGGEARVVWGWLGRACGWLVHRSCVVCGGGEADRREGGGWDTEHTGPARHVGSSTLHQQHTAPAAHRTSSTPHQQHTRITIQPRQHAHARRTARATCRRPAAPPEVGGGHQVLHGVHHHAVQRLPLLVQCSACIASTEVYCCADCSNRSPAAPTTAALHPRGLRLHRPPLWRSALASGSILRVAVARAANAAEAGHELVGYVVPVTAHVSAQSSDAGPGALQWGSAGGGARVGAARGAGAPAGGAGERVRGGLLRCLSPNPEP